MKFWRFTTFESVGLKRSPLLRVAASMAGVWLGLLVSLTFIAAPAAFALLDKPAAGILVGRLFAQEAALSALSSMVFVMILRRLTEHEASPRSPSPASDTRLWMVLGVLGCTVVGYYAMQPLLVAARVGQGALSFGLLHGISVAFFGLKMLLLLLLTWRLSC